ncbi:hypothetical protein F4811DRAFT_232808 [Daldinia bambusicola]|nr:hypothetical protein F4811DRAFT_232808 [Daldinia bambusicola]
MSQNTAIDMLALAALACTFACDWPLSTWSIYLNRTVGSAFAFVEPQSGISHLFPCEEHISSILSSLACRGRVFPQTHRY